MKALCKLQEPYDCDFSNLVFILETFYSPKSHMKPLYMKWM